ncbi:GH32 C-terminal domain-containing protein [Streptomyces sp. NPDC059970]|uniref:GH32 C-terminal domain-containing protein n=1 Tax=Streptomyces sp. NPDC059970 TaxID=3347019 RepID=UPI0036C1A5AC
MCRCPVRTLPIAPAAPVREAGQERPEPTPYVRRSRHAGTGGATEFGLRLRTGGSRRTAVGYDVGAGKPFVDRTDAGVRDFTEQFAGRTSTPLPQEAVDGERRLRIRLFMDTSSGEVFGGDGRATISSLLFPEPDDQGMAFYADGGEARIVTLTGHRLRDLFRVTDTGPDSPATPSGGEFRSGGLGDLTVVPAGHWTTTGADRTGTFDRDSTAVPTTVHGDLERTTPIRFGGPDGTSGAGSVLFRATPDTADVYAVNPDPNLRTARLFCRDGGRTTVLAEVPLLLRTGVTPPLRTDRGVRRRPSGHRCDGHPLCKRQDRAQCVRRPHRYDLAHDWQWEKERRPGPSNPRRRRESTRSVGD